MNTVKTKYISVTDNYDSLASHSTMQYEVGRTNSRILFCGSSIWEITDPRFRICGFWNLHTPKGKGGEVRWSEVCWGVGRWGEDEVRWGDGRWSEDEVRWGVVRWGEDEVRLGEDEVSEVWRGEVRWGWGEVRMKWGEGGDMRWGVERWG